MGDCDLSRRVVLHSKASGGVRDVSSIVCHHLFSSYLEAELSIVEPFSSKKIMPTGSCIKHFDNFYASSMMFLSDGPDLGVY